MKVNRSTLETVISKELLSAFPEHDKLQPHTQANWDIRDFMSYLMRSGVQVLYARAGRIEVMDFDEMEKRLLVWRGVDLESYRAETKALVEKYGGLLSALEREVVSVPEHVTLRQAAELGVIDVGYDAARRRIFRGIANGESVPQPIDAKASVFRYVTEDLRRWSEEWVARTSQYRESMRHLASPGTQPELPGVSEPVPVDPKQSLMDKIKLLRGEGEDDEAQVA